MKTCNTHPICGLLEKKHGRVKLSGIYRIYLGKRLGQKIWIVDGDRVCRELYPDFIMGGNDQRYRFNPPGDIWIDNRIGVEELEYTIAHELIERKLMQELGLSYVRAHNEGGLAKEKRMRDRDAARVAAHERTLVQLAPSLAHGGPRGRLVKPVGLSGIYRAFYGTVDGVSVWIVDGPKVRKDLHPDFCFGTHDLKSPIVPNGEIWLDSAMSIEESYYALMHQRIERKALSSGVKFDPAYDSALIAALDERTAQESRARKHEARLLPVSYGVRERGVKVKP